MYQDVIKTAKEKMEKTLAVTTRELATLRAGRANPQVLDKIQVDYYGTPSPINAVANISVPEPRMLVIAPWEAKMVSVIEKAILKSDVGINPSNDGKVIRLVFPELTEERRKDLCKQVRKQVEEGKVALRAIRRDANEQIKKMKKDSVITEDEAKTAEMELQKATDNAVKEADRLSAEKELQKLTESKIEMIDKVGAAKEKEIMEV